MRWESYKTWFTQRYDKIVSDLLEPGAVECNGGPIVTPTVAWFPKEAPWRTDWAIIFTDGKYVRVKESYRRDGSPGSGVREHFSFHYGVAHPEMDARGFPKSNPKDNPPIADLRIDIDKSLIPHIHVNSPEHLGQAQVEGFSIQDAEMFEFLEAVRDHRKTGDALTDLLKIRLIK
jgi:hypothetical protein